MFVSQLTRKGFTNLDALDGCPEMMDLALKKNIYKKMILHILGDAPIPIESSRYIAQSYIQWHV